MSCGETAQVGTTRAAGTAGAGPLTSPGGPAALRVDGGLTRSVVLMQAQADLLGRPVEVYPYTCATALGIAAMALRGLDGPGAEATILDGWRPRAVYQPSGGQAAAAAYARWVESYQRVRA